MKSLASKMCAPELLFTNILSAHNLGYSGSEENIGTDSHAWSVRALFLTCQGGGMTSALCTQPVNMCH